MRAVAARGRWIWAVSGVVTMAFLVVPGIHLITSGGQNEHVEPQATVARTVTVPQPVTSLTVQSYGAQVQVTAGPVRHVKITETITYDTPAGDLSAVPQQASASPVSALPAGTPAAASADPAAPAAPDGPGGPANPGGTPPAVALSVSGGHLSLADPACASSDCSVGFTVFTPPGVTATVITDGGPVTVSGIAGANVDSGGGPVTATTIGGPLTVSTEGGSLVLDGLAGPLRADTDGGPLTARNVAGSTVTVTTGGGSAWMAFAAAPDSVTVSTDGGPAELTVPGGPYALAANSNGGPQSVGIATDPAARRSITIITDSGSLGIAPSRG